MISVSKGFVSILLPAALTLLSCGERTHQTVMIKAQLLSLKELDYPSGSAINIYGGELYLAGDDAPDMIILDTEFNRLRTVPIFPGYTGRIEKAVKADIEAGDFVGDTLWLFSSGSKKPHRDSLFLYDKRSSEIRKSDLSTIYSRLQKETKELNIEAAAFIKGSWFLGNRSNNSQKQNHLILLAENFADDQEQTAVRLVALNPPHPSAGISGMAYDENQDILYMTFSVEETANAYDDGQAGDSFLALVRNISTRQYAEVIVPDEWLNIAETDSSISGMKIESVAIADNGILFLTADNDNGKTVLYKLSVDSN